MNGGSGSGQGLRRLWVGCCGWAEARQKYFREFPTIELETTFYQPPSVELAQRWKQEAPDGFRFCMKAWQWITHAASSPTYRRLKAPLPEKSRSAVGFFRPTEEVWGAWRTTLEIAAALDAAVIVFQCPASFRPEPDNIRNLEAFFHKVGDCGRRLAWEPRGSWPAGVVKDLCAQFNLIHCVDPFAAKPVTDGTRYYRLHGRGGYNYRYEDAELEELIRFVETGAAGDVYVLFNNVYMQEDARRFLALVASRRQAH